MSVREPALDITMSRWEDDFEEVMARFKDRRKLFMLNRLKPDFEATLDSICPKFGGESGWGLTCVLPRDSAAGGGREAIERCMSVGY